MQAQTISFPNAQIAVLASEQAGDLGLCRWLEQALNARLDILPIEDKPDLRPKQADLLLVAPGAAQVCDLEATAQLARQAAAALVVFAPAERPDMIQRAWQAGAAAVVACDSAGSYRAYLGALLQAQLQHAAEQQRLARDQRYFTALLEQMPDSIYFKDRECRLQLASRKMLVDLGLTSSEQIAGRTDLELFGPEFGRRMLQIDRSIIASGKPVIGMIESRRLPGGQVNWTSTSKVPLLDRHGAVVGLVGITHEINELKQAELELQFLATHDHLTRLPNRYLLEDRLQQGLASARRHNRNLTLIFIDLDGFKPINDQYGHLLGDQLLSQVAERLRQSLRESDTVARLGGDEFLAILESSCDSQVLARIAQQLCERLAEPYALLEKQLCLTASLGLSCYPQDGLEARQLIEAADAAMYLSKQRGGNCYTFSGAAS